MPTKDPITVVSVLASILLITGGVMLYLMPALQAPPEAAVILSSPFKEPAPTKTAVEPVLPPTNSTPPPLLTIPELTPDDLKKLSADERNNYDKMRESLKQALQQLQAIEQENQHLQQKLEQGEITIQTLDAEISKIRAAEQTATASQP